MTNPTSLPNIYTRPYSLNDDYKRSPQVNRSALWVSSVRYLQSNSSTRCEEWWQFIATQSTQLEQHHKKLINCFRETTLILFNLTRSNLLSITFDTHYTYTWLWNAPLGWVGSFWRASHRPPDVRDYQKKSDILILKISVWCDTALWIFISVYMPMESTYTCT